MMRGRTRHEEDEQSRALYQLSALVLNLLRSPLSSLTFSDEVPPLAASRRPGLGQISPAGFASLLLGISLALMLCGSVTFFIGFVLMPWVLGLVMLFYVAGILSSLSVFGRSILCYATAPPSPRKDIPETLMLGNMHGSLCEVTRWKNENEEYDGVGFCAVYWCRNRG
ncbi:hypothetical protein GmHk_11G033457 [Glycine max]|nr:hypothetical protein GmHk_11G033457 [Glycine max]